MDSSSRISSAGSVARPRARASICCSPPDSVPAVWRRRSRQPREPRVRHLLDLRAATCRVGHHPEVLAHGEVGEDAPALGDQAQPAAGQIVGRGAVDPATGDQHVARRCGGCRPAATRSVVVLPAPFGPSTATTEPAGTGRSTPCSTLMPSYAARTPRSSSSGPACGRSARPHGRAQRLVVLTPARAGPGTPRGPPSWARISSRGAHRQHAAVVEHVDRRRTPPSPASCRARPGSRPRPRRRAGAAAR